MEKENDTLTSNSQNIEKIFRKEDEIITPDIEKIVDDIMQNKNEQRAIAEKIIKRSETHKHKIKPIDGFIYQKIISTDNIHIHIKDQLISKLPQGIIAVENKTQVNYEILQKLLINQKFREADKVTQEYLCELIKQKIDSKRNWLYFTDIQFLPKKDLFTIDLMWRVYSKGKFGFSTQKRIWIKNNRNWDKLWESIYWLKHGIMKRYPEEFIWTIDAPEGHLPLFNQLRGTQTLLYLFHNIEW